MNNNLKIPKELNKKYLPTCLSICSELFLNKNNRAVIISESIVKRPHKNSDLDIVVITNNNFWQRKQLYINKVFVELFFYSEIEITNSFNTKDYQDMHMIAYGYVIFDKDSVVGNLKKIALKKFKLGPGKLSKDERLLRKYLIWDDNQDILDILNKDKVTALSLMNKSVLSCTELFFALNNKWPCKPKLLMQSVKDIDIDLYYLLNRFYLISGTNLTQKYKIYKKIATKMVYPHDINKPLIWVSKKYKNK